MVKEATTERLFKAKLVALIDMYFGATTANMYKASYQELPIEFVEKSSEKLFTEYLGSERAQALIKQTKEDL